MHGDSLSKEKRLKPIASALGLVLVSLVSGVAGSAMTRHFGTSSYTLSYADFVSVMLTAVSVLITVLAIFLAVFAFLGWTTIEQKAQLKTEEFLNKELASGGRLDRVVLDRVNSKIEELMFQGVQPVDDDEVGDPPSEGNKD